MIHNWKLVLQVVGLCGLVLLPWPCAIVTSYLSHRYVNDNLWNWFLLQRVGWALSLCHSFLTQKTLTLDVCPTECLPGQGLVSYGAGKPLSFSHYCIHGHCSPRDPIRVTSFREETVPVLALSVLLWWSKPTAWREVYLVYTSGSQFITQELKQEPKQEVWRKMFLLAHSSCVFLSSLGPHPQRWCHPQWVGFSHSKGILHKHGHRSN